MKQICILGDAGVGKTCLIKHLNNEYMPKVYYQSFHKEEVKIGNNYYTAYPYNYNISNEDFSQYNQCLIMFDMSSKPSFDNAKNLYYQILKKGTNIDIVLIGNKIDKRQVHFFNNVQDKDIENWNKTQIYVISLLTKEGL